METSDILIILAGAVLVAGGIFMILRRYVFLKMSCTARVGGKVLDIERNVTRHIDKPDRVSHSMKYHYFVDGVEYAKSRSVGKHQLKTTGDQGYITVCYDPSKPKRHYILELKFRMLMTLGLIALGAVLLYYPYYNF